MQNGDEETIGSSATPPGRNMARAQLRAREVLSRHCHRRIGYRPSCYANVDSPLVLFPC